MKKRYFKIALTAILALTMICSAFSLFGCSGSGNLPDVNNTVTPTPNTTRGTTQDTTEDTTDTASDTTETTETTDTESATTETEEVTTNTEETSEEVTSDTLDTEETEESVDTEDIGEPGGVLDTDITLFADGETDFTIVVAKKASSTVSNAAAQIKSALSSKYSVSTEVKNEDFFKLLNGGTLEGHKIVVGSLVGEEETKELEMSLRDDGYVIKIVNGSLYIIGGTDEATAQGVSYFINAYLKGGEESLTLEKGLLYEKYTTASVRSMKIADNEIWKYTIVYHDSEATKRYVAEIQKAIASATGYTLPIASDSTQAGEYEILVGDTNRKESVNVKSSYSSPSLYYDMKVVGKKLVCMGEGWNTLKKLSSLISDYFSKMTSSNSNMKGSIISGNIKSKIDSSGMLDRASGTDVRVFNFNIYGVTYDYETYTTFSNDAERGEYMADVALMYYPDVITTNELFNGHPEFKSFVAHLSKHYTLITESKYDSGNPTGITDPSTTLNYCGIPVQIFIKKSCKFTVVDSGWRYISEPHEADSKYVNPWHGIHWAVLKTTAGKSFIVSVGHYGDGRTDDTFAREHQAAIATAQTSSGSSATLPTVAAGDFFSSPTEACYKYHVNTKGFIDPQKVSSINLNGSTAQATCHPLGKTRTSGVIYDFILHNNKFSALKFKILKSTELEYASDHYPVCVDLKFK